MAVNVSNAFVANPIDIGVLFSAALGSTLPDDATTAIAAPFLANDHGAVGEDGFSVSPSRSSKDIKMFGGGVFIDVQDEYTETAKIVLLEDDNDAVIKTTFGDANVTTTAATSSAGTKRTIYHTDDVLPIKSYVLQAKSGDKRKRFVIEKARVSEVAEIKSQHSDVTRMELTLKVFKNSTGKYVVEYRDDGKFSA
ncbi:hypothetical protein LH935_06915 [Gordonia polyisoprenivorans]|uniref:hypothetical protein n=1 Tax=Gordonia polyisoprenivorans TaxID=84595 RepID=UPI00223472DA|nr:hypothetical protein LH935_06915 [Gordonia polyisoprenivorans]